MRKQVSFTLREVLERVLSDAKELHDLPARGYHLGVAIVDKTKDFKPAINIAIRNEKAETGWYHLATINVKSA